MSAWLLSKQEIDVLVHWLHKTGVSNALPDSLGAMLWSENYKSIRARYGDYDYRTGKYVKRPAYHYQTPKSTNDFDVESKDQALKMVHFYSYQTCEHDSYYSSRAHKMMDKLANVLEAQGADYHKEGLKWGM